MKADDQEEAWVFRFVLESSSGQTVARHEANEMFEQIIEWAENHGLQIGGSYRAPDESDEEPQVESSEGSDETR